ncbi:MAG: GNAT family N-acetyltransferase [Candidatus Cloacimonetes bacterium]|jgi:GNAT superfamily N-acetyltransferase|nr:GNAT family N-acetyltransferase [Candidatus Cloacimonadota bacterium]MCK9334968.1 GNAT family N-acetyltransferase [Candidatus Cloacimonadota bacterium]MDD4034011.1 GNAT family N-acetyltransferase [Candidatus Cloacimonadota bacterium]
MPFQNHENVYYYKDMFNQDAVLASVEETKEMNRNIEFLIMESIPLQYRAKMHALESLAYPYWKEEFVLWENTLIGKAVWSVALDSDEPITTIRAYPSMNPDMLTINYLSTEQSYRKRGLARAVIQNCINHVFTNGVYSSIQALDISSPGAAKILEQVGFVRNRQNIDIMRSMKEFYKNCKT